MFDRIKKLLGAKEQLQSVAQNAQEIATKATAAYQDIAKDGIGLDDIAKVQSHAQNIAGDVKEIVEDVQQVAATTKSS